MNIFEENNYKTFVLNWIRQQEKPRGYLKNIANHLRVHTTMISHIFRGDLHLTLEQAIELCEFLNLSSLETEYFYEMVQFERAGSYKLKEIIKKKMKAITTRANLLKERLPNQQQELSELQKSIFYSNWTYSAVRLLATLNLESLNEIQNKLQIPKEEMTKVIEFLTSSGICEKNDNKLISKNSLTHIGSDSPFILKHHQNWRLKSMQRFNSLGEEELCYTAPLTIAKKDMIVFRAKIIELIEDLKKIVQSTKPDSLACFNIDWVKF